jgi:hypothetical protein
MAKSLVGPVINIKGMVYGPVEKFGVMFLFARLTDESDFVIEEILPDEPRIIARRQVKGGLERVEIAFAFNSSEARNILSNSQCDILVCWNHDWIGCECEVVELKTQLLSSNHAAVIENKLVGRSHTSDVAGTNPPNTEPVPEEKNEEEEELHRKFNQTIKEIDEKIKDLF